MAASALLAETVYSIGANVIIDSAVRAITGWDIITSLMKSWVFGVIISVVRPVPHVLTLSCLPSIPVLGKATCCGKVLGACRT